MSMYLTGGFQHSGFFWTVLGLQVVNGLAVNRMHSARVLELVTQALPFIRRILLCLLPDLLEHARLLINNALTNHLVKCHCIFKVVGYNIQIRESGEEYTETIEVDTEKQTELFKVPAHVNVDQSNILHDFKKVSLSS